MKFILSLLQLRRIRKLRVQRHLKTVLTRKSVFFHESVRTIEQTFFWRVLSIATIGLFFFSIVPSLSVSSISYASQDEEVTNDSPDDLVFVEDGFLLKPEMWTEVGDRSNVGGAIQYLVQPDDTISGIAERFGVSQATVLQNNDFLDPKSLKPGMTLKIPAADGLLYVVQKGESIESIGKKHNVDAAKILTQNQLASSSVLQEGQELIIPGVKKEPPKPKRSAVARTSAGGRVFISGDDAPQGKETFGRLLFPTQGQFTQYYHYGHYAVDIANRGGATIWAADGGTIVRAASGWNGGYGNIVVIDHGNGMKTLYGHLKEIYVSVGDTVNRGTPVGFMGHTGRVYGRTGIHLHFEVIVNGAKKNPLAYL